MQGPPRGIHISAVHDSSQFSHLTGLTLSLYLHESGIAHYSGSLIALSGKEHQHTRSHTDVRSGQV